jgi:hypothetical protein
LQAKACGFRFSFALFFVQKKSAAKEVKKRAVLSLVTSAVSRNFFRLPELKFCSLCSQNLLGTTANFRPMQIFRSLQSGAHAHNQSCSRL